MAAQIVSHLVHKKLVEAKKTDKSEVALILLGTQGEKSQKIDVFPAILCSKSEYILGLLSYCCEQVRKTISTILDTIT